MRFANLCMALLGVATLSLANAQVTIHDLNVPLQKSEISVMDVDRDGDQDILVIGLEPGIGPAAQLLQNDGGFTFSPISSPFLATEIVSVGFGDLEGDGDLDIIQSGFDQNGSHVYVYRTNQNGSLERDSVLGDSLIQIAPSCGMADLNNDGYTDLYVFGNHNINDQRPRLYFGQSDGSFQETSPFDTLRLIDSRVYPVDYDVDGDLDLWVTAGYEATLDARYARMFENDGDANFTAVDLGLFAKNPGHSEWADFDEDGDLDLLINGDGFVNSGEDDDFIYRLYRNDGGTFVEHTTFQPYRQLSYGDGSRMVDWDQDGELDIILTGFNSAAGTQKTAIFLQNAGQFTLATYSDSLPGVSESAIEVSDLDSDGDLDLVINGFSANEFDGAGSAFNANVSVIIENTFAASNAAPSTPGNLGITRDGSTITFSWDESTDDLTASNALTYNFFLKDSNEVYFYRPMADEVTGTPLIQEAGNVGLNNAWTVKNLPDGTYTWGVQGVDHSFAASAFATNNFSIPEASTSIVDANTVDLRLFPNPAQYTITLEYNDVGPAVMQILSVQGQVVMQGVLDAREPQRVNISTLAEGMYILQVRTDRGTVSKRFVKQNL